MTIGTLLWAASTTWAQKMWTMDDGIDYALQHSAKVMKSRVEADSARQDRGAAMAGFMPTVAGSVGTQFSWGRNVDPETNTYNTITTFNNSYSLGGSVTLFDGAQTWNAFRKARLPVSRSDNTLAVARDERTVKAMEEYVDPV